MSTDNCLPVGLTGTEVADLLTFFMSACKYYGSDGQTLQLRQKNVETLHASPRIYMWTRDYQLRLDPSWFYCFAFEVYRYERSAFSSLVCKKG